MNTRRGASTCRWAAPTLLLPAPIWFEAEDSPWTCLRDAAPRALETTNPCAICQRWEPRPSTVPPKNLDREQVVISCPITVPVMVDWFGAFRPPHETDWMDGYR